MILDTVKEKKSNMLYEISYFWHCYLNIIIKNINKIFSFLNSNHTRYKNKDSLEHIFINIVKDKIFENLKPQLIDEFLKELSKLRVKNEKKYQRIFEDLIKDSSSKNINVNNSNKMDLDSEIIIDDKCNYDKTGLRYFVNMMNHIVINPGTNAFTSELENGIIKNATESYDKIFINALENKIDLYEYLQKGLELLKDELADDSSYLPESTIKRKQEELIKVLFFNNSKKIIESNMPIRLEKSDFNCLRLLFDIFKEDKKNGLNIMNYMYKQYLKKQINAFIQDYKAKNLESYSDILSTDYIEKFYIFYQGQLEIIQDVFKSENIFKISFNDVIEHTQITDKLYNNSYIFSFYLHTILSKSIVVTKKINKESIYLNENEIKNQLEIESELNDLKVKVGKIIELFNSIPEKDVFVESHQKFLSLRLLNDDCISIETEKKIIENLKKIGGYNYITNLEIILKNSLESDKFKTEFFDNFDNIEETLNSSMLNFFFGKNNFSDSNFISYKMVLNSRINVKLLEADKWKLIDKKSTHLPFPFNIFSDRMKKYYNSKHQHRNLLFDTEFSTVDVLYRYLNYNFLFKLNLSQACVLLCFNSYKSKSIHISDLEKKTLIDKNNLYNAITYLITTGVLLKDNDDNITFNHNCKIFSTEKVLAFDKYEVIKEEKVSDNLIQTRSYAMEAAIIRVLKKKKEINHTELLLKLKLEPFLYHFDNKDVKEKIVELLDKGYIERHNENTEIYRYSL